ncbi:MAG: hypothetical protein ACTS6A_02235 [Candidatus Hodgkinia cicadicola]
MRFPNETNICQHKSLSFGLLIPFLSLIHKFHLIRSPSTSLVVITNLASWRSAI